MTLAPYEYTIEQCDIPKARRGCLEEYRKFRHKCLEYLRGDADTSVMIQVHGLAWHTATFRTLNEARRLEADRPVNGAMWELITAGYANIVALGIRKLVDRDPRTDSVWNVLGQVEKRPELLRRENFICHDGLPYDYEAVMRDHVGSSAFGQGGAVWLPTKEPTAWGTSQLLQQAFDALAGYPPETQPSRRARDRFEAQVAARAREHQGGLHDGR